MKVGNRDSPASKFRMDCKATRSARLQQKDIRDQDPGGLALLLKNARMQFADLADCRVIVGDVDFPCHTAVLYARSPYFRSLIVQQAASGNDGTVATANTDNIGHAHQHQLEFRLETHLNAKVVDLLLSYIYSGIIPLEIDHSLVKDTLEVALLFELPRFHNVIARRFRQQDLSHQRVAAPVFTLEKSLGEAICSDYQISLDDGTAFRVHSVVLACQSLYIRSICSLRMWEENQQRTIALHGIDKVFAQRLLSFFYTGAWTGLSYHETKNILSLGDYLRCDNLVELAATNVANRDVGECASVLDMWAFVRETFPGTDTCVRLEEACVAFFETNLRHIWMRHRPVILGLSDGMMTALLRPGNIAEDSRVLQDMLWAWAKHRVRQQQKQGLFQRPVMATDPQVGHALASSPSHAPSSPTPAASSPPRRKRRRKRVSAVRKGFLLRAFDRHNPLAYRRQWARAFCADKPARDRHSAALARFFTQTPGLRRLIGRILLSFYKPRKARRFDLTSRAPARTTSAAPSPSPSPSTPVALSSKARALALVDRFLPPHTMFNRESRAAILDPHNFIHQVTLPSTFRNTRFKWDDGGSADMRDL